MASDSTMDDGVGMRLQLEGKKTLTIGTDNLELHGTAVPESESQKESGF